jgi:hypothetical protein
VLVDVDADVKRLRSSEKDEGGRRRCCRSVLARPYLDLQDFRVQRSANKTAIDFDGDGVRLRRRRRDLRPSFLHVRGRRLHRRPPPGKLLDADGSFVGDALDELELTRQIRKTRLGRTHACAGDQMRLPTDGEIGAQMPRVDLEERLPGRDFLARGHEHPSHHAADGRSHGDVLRARFHEADRRDRGVEVGDRRQAGRIGQLARGVRANESVGRPGAGEDAENRKDATLHDGTS